ncbi:MAG: PmoA family protein [Pirellulaceae bacterium]
MISPIRLVALGLTLIAWGAASPAARFEAAEPLRWEETPERITLYQGERPILRYNIALVPSPDASKPWFGRSGFIHPIWDPAGRVLTDDFPPDHMHQHALMFPWTKTQFEGRKIDFWNSALQQGKVEHRRMVSQFVEEDLAGLEVELAHVDITDPENPKDVLIERWNVVAHRDEDAFVFDLTSVQRCASDSPLTILEYHYGGLGIRGARAWATKGQGDFLTSDGKTRVDGNHTTPRWVDVHGKLEGEVSGITVMGHPENFRFPQPVRLHPDKPYFSFTPQVKGSFAIRPGQPYTSKYRFVAHRGMIDQETTERLWEDFSGIQTEQKQAEEAP